MRTMFIGVQESFLILCVLIPTGAEEQPTVFWQWAVFGNPCLNVFDFNQKIRVLGGFGAEIQDDGGPNQACGFNLCHVFAVFTGAPVDWCIEVGAYVVAMGKAVGAPPRSGGIKARDLFQAEVVKVGKRLG